MSFHLLHLSLPSTLSLLRCLAQSVVQLPRPCKLPSAGFQTPLSRTHSSSLPTSLFELVESHTPALSILCLSYHLFAPCTNLILEQRLPNLARPSKRHFACCSALRVTSPHKGISQIAVTVCFRGGPSASAAFLSAPFSRELALRSSNPSPPPQLCYSRCAPSLWQAQPSIRAVALSSTPRLLPARMAHSLILPSMAPISSSIVELLQLVSPCATCC